MRDHITRFFVNTKQLFLQLGWLLAIIIPLFVFINWAVFSIVAAQRDAIDGRFYTSAQKELQSIDLYVNAKLQAIHDDIHVIINANETTDYLADSSIENTAEYQNFLYRIMSSKPSFYNMMMVDTDGDILYHVQRQDDNVNVVSGALGTIATTHYYNAMLAMDEEEELFLSQLYLKDHHPLMTLVKPLYHDHALVSYVVVDYYANDLLSILSLYTTDEEDYFEFGLLNNGVLWEIDKEQLTLGVNADTSYRNQLFERIIANDYVVTYTFSLIDQSDHFYVEDQNVLRFFIDIDIHTAIMESESVFLKNAQWIAAGVNILAGVLISFLAYMVRVRKDDRLIINANMYLSVQNKDSVVIVDRNLRILYINPAFERMFGYDLKYAYLKKFIPLTRVQYIPMTYDPKKITDISYHEWGKTKVGIHLLHYVRMKKETFFAGQDRHYIAIYTNSQIDVGHYRTFVEKKNETLDELYRFFDFQSFHQEESTLFMIYATNVDLMALARYLHKHISRQYIMAIPQKDHIMIYAKIHPMMLQKEVIHVDNLLETFSSLPDTNRNFQRLFVVANANETISNMHLLLEAVLTSLAYAKEQKHVRYLLYQDHIRQFVERQKHIEKELENGFRNQEFYLEYQVIKHVEKNMIIGAEALLRWHNQRLGSISPMDFIPVIENSFYINKLTLMVLRLAIDDFETMMDGMDQDFRISINLSQFDLGNDYIIDQMLVMIHQSTLSPTRFAFEITESQYMFDVERANRMIDKLHDQGILVSVDDFGTGYSSINLLKSIDVDLVKIDRMYIRNYPGEDDGQMLNTLVQLVHRFEKPIVIEGVETKAHIEYCKANQCEYAQGYYLSKPIKADVFKERFINKGSFIKGS